jgi:hypothetical protein
MRQAMFAKRQAKHLVLPTASIAASTSQEKDICRAETAKPPLSTAPRECPPGNLGSMPTGDPDYPGDALAQAAEAQSKTTAHRTTARIDVCSPFKWAKINSASKSTCLEAEPIYETDSNTRL